MKYLGATIDIHTGGMDLIPIHHENEIAQSESATGHPFVRCFVHNAFLVGKSGLKISKSAGKFPLLADVTAAGHDPLAYRLFCFSAKYRSELALSDEGLRSAQSNLDYLREFARNTPVDAGETAPDSEFAADYEQRFVDALNDDLNTPRALAEVLEMVAEAYRRDDRRIWKTLTLFDRVLGLDLAKARASAKPLLSAEVQRLIDERAEAHQAEFQTADELRA